VVSATLSYAALRSLGELHIKDCVRVAQAVRHPLPAPGGATETSAPPRPATRLATPVRPSWLSSAWHRLRPR